MRYKNICTEKIFHAGVKIKNNSTVCYIDPLSLPTDAELADFIFITHEHLDHCSVDDVKKIINNKTTIVTIPACEEKLRELDCHEIKIVKPQNTIEFPQLKVLAVHAYNTNKFRPTGEPCHPKEHNKVGFVLEIDEIKIYHAGDTDVIPEMNELKNINVALVPVSGIFTMTPEEAAEAVEIIQPELAVPIHYGDFEFNGRLVGAKENGEKFKSLCKTPVNII